MISLKALSARQFLLAIIAIVVLTDVAVLFDIPVLRQLLGLLFFTFLPGLLIVLILRLDKLELVTKLVLSVGLSVAFSMLFGLLVNSSLLAIGYTTPLSTVPLLISFSIAIATLAAVAYIRNRNITFSFSGLNLTTREKALLIVPSFFPLLSIAGMRIMNLTNNNMMLMVLLFLIPAYVIFISFSNRKVPQRVYPIAILMIGVALVLMFSLRSAHILGADMHWTYDLYQATSQNLHWSILRNSILDACLSITLLPSAVQSVLNINPEYIFKVFYSLIFATAPLCIYSISKRYVHESYAFIASICFMSQFMFISAAYSPRSILGIFFFALAMMVLFSIELKPIQRSLLFILFMVSMVISHYSAAYITFFLILGAFLGLLIIQQTLKAGKIGASKGREVEPQSTLEKYTPRNILSPTIVCLFFVFLFFWYSQVTAAPFVAGVNFIEGTFANLNQFFIFESRSGGNVPAVLGEDIMYKGIPHKIEFVFTWIIFTFIAIGAIAMWRRLMFSRGSRRLKPGALRANFEMEYLVMTGLCGALLVAMVALPVVGTAYGIQRAYTQASVILSVSFVIGGILLSEHIKRIRVKPYLLILVVLIPYFFCVSGPMYQVFGYPRDITLNSQDRLHTRMYIYDAESNAAKWLEQHGQDGTTIYVDGFSKEVLVSQSNIPYQRIGKYLISTYQQGKEIDGYIWLRYVDMIEGGLVTKYPGISAGKSKIYANSRSETYK